MESVSDNDAEHGGGLAKVKLTRCLLKQQNHCDLLQMTALLSTIGDNQCS